MVDVILKVEIWAVNLFKQLKGIPRTDQIESGYVLIVEGLDEETNPLFIEGVCGKPEIIDQGLTNLLWRDSLRSFSHQAVET
jgi:hypothetical protein